MPGTRASSANLRAMKAKWQACSGVRASNSKSSAVLSGPRSSARRCATYGAHVLGSLSADASSWLPKIATRLPDFAMPLACAKADCRPGARNRVTGRLLKPAGVSALLLHTFSRYFSGSERAIPSISLTRCSASRTACRLSAKCVRALAFISA